MPLRASSRAAANTRLWRLSLLSLRRTIGEAMQRARIRAIADDLGYVFDATAATFRSQKTSFVAVTIPSINNANFADTVRGLSEGLKERGLQILLGTFVLLASFAASIPVTARIVRPMRALFVSHSAIGNAALVGQSCKVLTQKVDDRQGRAEVARLGASINIRVWSPSPNALQRGDTALITEYDAGAHRYLVMPLPPE